MTRYGWMLLILSWTFIIALNVFCFVKVLGKKDGRRKANASKSD